MTNKLECTLEEIQSRILEIAVEFDCFCRKNDINYFVCGGTLLGGVRHQDFIPWDDDFDVAMLRSDFDKFTKLWEDTARLKLMSRGGVYGHNKYGCPLKLSSKTEYLEEIGDKKRGMIVPNNYGFYIDIFPIDRYPDTLIGNITYNYLGKLYLMRHLAEFNYDYRTMRERILFRLTKFIPLRVINKLVRTSVSKLSSNKNGFLGYGVDTPFDKLKLSDEDIFPLSEVSINGYKFLAPKNWERYLHQRFGDYMKLPPVTHRVGHIQNIYQLEELMEREE